MDEEKQNEPMSKDSNLETPKGPADIAAAHSARNKKRFFMVMASALFVIAGSFLILGMSSNDNNTEETAQVQQPAEEDRVVALAAAISIVEGNVQYSSDGEAWVDATGGETVNAGDYVRTLAGSRTVLLIDDGSAVRLDGESQVQLAVSDTMSVEVMLVSGQVYSRVVESESRVFAVVTENERFEALGTAYKTSTGDVDQVEVYQSSVKVDTDDTTIDEGNRYDTASKEKSSIDLAALEQDDFVQWNKQKDSESNDFKDKLGVLKDKEEAEETPVEQPAPGPSAGITLSGQAVDDGVKLSWSLNGVSSTDGFKLVRAKSDSTPTYKEDTSVYVSKGDQRSYTIDLKDGKTYYFRVCIYRASGGTCDTYSNAIQVTAPDKPLEQVTPGAVNLNIEGASVSWSFAGTAPHGFKVVLSSEQNPTYPSNSIQYVGPETTSTTLPEKPAGTYYVRVCKYTASSEISGGCTDYSNQVTYVVE